MKLEEVLLRQLYLQEGLSLRATAARLGTDASTVRHYMKKYGIVRRTKSEALSGDRNPMFGKIKSLEVRLRTSATLQKTNALPEVKARRSAAVTGPNNPMFGRSHRSESRFVMSQKQKERTSDPAVRATLSRQSKDCWQRPSFRRAVTERASKRVGSKNPFFGRTHSDATKKLISVANTGRFRGDRGSNWKDGRTRLSVLVRNSESMIRWRKAVFERDLYICKDCGQVGGKLNADHIVPLAVILRKYQIKSLDDAYRCSMLWDVANGKTLCVPCHKKTPSYAGSFQKNFKEVV